MGKPRAPEPVLLFTGALYCNGDIFLSARKVLETEFGPVFMETAESLWHCEYYRAELGWPIRRKFLFFDRLISPGDLAAVKIRTNAIEEAFSEGGARRVNLDPGYIGLPKLVLASTKDYGHRVYLGRGIYAEVELLYNRARKTFEPLSYTFRDYRDRQNIEAFTEARRFLKGKLLSLENLEKRPE